MAQVCGGTERQNKSKSSREEEGLQCQNSIYNTWLSKTKLNCNQRGKGGFRIVNFGGRMKKFQEAIKHREWWPFKEC